MIYSMTGFGRARREAGGLGLEVEMRSVNHRHLDLRVRLPRILADQESTLKKRIQTGLSRGKVDVTVSLTMTNAKPVLEFDEGIAAQYVEASNLLRERHSLTDALDVASLLGLPGVTRVVEAGVDAEVFLAPLEGAIDEALEAMIAMRATEGESLATELEGRLSTISALAEAFERRAEEVLVIAKQRLTKRTEQIRQDVGLLDDARLHQEIVIAADRLDITEELVRLQSHVAQFRQTLSSAGPGQPVGRRLDFLLQELGREANTVGSKANDAPLAQDVVELKTELERIREQVQNIE
ncbi:MAG TPA: YicC family protein [Myxococcales bacterium]|nr:YicC family protein [Myxococcales bacterium]HIK85003.1 YicC family protein [Myxococcales bacterium]